MLPDIGGLELLVIAAVALIVVGPKDLPMLLRKLGQFVGKMRGMASEFRASFDEMARQSELDDLRREVEAMRSGQYTAPLREAADQAKDAGVDQVFADIDASLSSGSMQAHPYAGYQPAGSSDEPSILSPDTEVAPVAVKPRKPKASKPKASKVAAPKPAVVKIAEPAAVKTPRKRVAKTEAPVDAVPKGPTRARRKTPATSDIAS